MLLLIVGGLFIHTLRNLKNQDLGLRYLLPAYPFVFVGIGWAFATAFKSHRRATIWIGVVLALIVVAIVLSLFGFWIAGVPIAVVGAILFVLFILGWGRRAAEGKP